MIPGREEGTVCEKARLVVEKKLIEVELKLGSTELKLAEAESLNFTINSSFWAGVNPITRALHRFTSVGMIASTPYVRENGVSPVDLLRVVRYARKTLGNSSVHLPFLPSNLFFSPFTIALLVALAWPLLLG